MRCLHIGYKRSLDAKVEKQLSAYISARYGKENLGLFSALCSYESFRAAASEDQLSKLLGMNLLSFEKYLALKGVILSGTPNGGRRVLVNKKVRFSFTDDPASSITGLLVEKLRALYPEANGLVSQPLVQVVTGGDIEHMYTNARAFEYPAEVHTAILNGEAGELVTAAQRYHACASATGEELIDKFNLVESWHKFLVAIRKNDATGQDMMLEFNSAEDYEKAIEGEIDCSLKFYKKKGYIPERIQDEWRTFYPAPEYRVELSGDKREFRTYRVGSSLCGKLKLAPAPAWIENLTSESLFDVEGAPAQEEVEPKEDNPRPTGVPEASAGSGPSAGVDNEPPEGVREGVDHVIQWADQDTSKLSPANLEICWCGFSGAKPYLEGVSKAALNRVFKAVSAGKHRDVLVIYEMSRLLKNVVNKHTPTGDPLPPLTPVQLGKMTGGQVVKRKSNFKFYDDGQWERLPSPGDF